MADSSKTVWLGLGWSSLVAGVLMLVTRRRGRRPSAWRLLAIIFGWLVFAAWRS